MKYSTQELLKYDIVCLTDLKSLLKTFLLCNHACLSANIQQKFSCTSGFFNWPVGSVCIFYDRGSKEPGELLTIWIADPLSYHKLILKIPPVSRGGYYVGEGFEFERAKCKYTWAHGTAFVECVIWEHVNTAG